MLCAKKQCLSAQGVDLLIKNGLERASLSFFFSLIGKCAIKGVSLWHKIKLTETIR